MTYIVALTAFTNIKTEEECLGAGIKRVINKPLTFPVLNEVMWKYFFLKQENNIRDSIIDENEEDENDSSLGDRIKPRRPR